MQEEAIFARTDRSWDGEELGGKIRASWHQINCSGDDVRWDEHTRWGRFDQILLAEKFFAPDFFVDYLKRLFVSPMKNETLARPNYPNS